METYDSWELYLQTLANQKELNTTQKKIFCIHFDRNNLNSTRDRLAKKIYIQPETYKINLTIIYRAFEEECIFEATKIDKGININNQSKIQDKRPLLFAWLEHNYPIWLKEWGLQTSFSNDDIWQELMKLETNDLKRLRVMKAKLATAGFDDEGEDRLLRVVSKSPIWIELEVSKAGYLILLDRDATGEITLLSPSPYIPDPRMTPGKHRFPQMSSEKKAFKPATLGNEVLMAVILPKAPPFEWTKLKEKCVRMEANEMQEFWEFLKENKPLQVTKLQIVIIPEKNLY